MKRKTRFGAGALASRPLASMLACGMAATGWSARAADLIWDVNAAVLPNPQDGGAAWTTTVLNWWDGATNVVWANNVADTAVFGSNPAAIPSGVAGGVPFTVAITTGHLRFEPYVGNVVKYNLSGGTGGSLTMGAASPVVTLNTDWVRPFVAVNGVIAGTAGFSVATSAGGILEIGTQANTITGGIRLGAGSTLSVGGDTSYGGAGNPLSFEGNSTLLSRNAHAVTTGRGFTIANGSTATIDCLAGTMTQGGAISETAGSGSLAKAGQGILSLFQANGYTGTTTVRAGSLILDFANAGVLASNIIHPSSGLRLRGGTLRVTGKASTANSQTFNGLTLDPGHSTLAATAGATGGSTAVVLGAISRNAGGTLNVESIAPGTSYTTTTTATNGIIGGFATVANTGWLSVDGGGNLVPLATYQTNGDPTTWAATDNVSLAADPSPGLAGDTTVNSLRFTASTGLQVPAGSTLTVSSGGILNTGTGALDIYDGTIRGSASGDLAVFQHSTTLASIASVIADNGGATSLTKAGAGTLVLEGANTYSGNTFVHGGVLEVSDGTNLGTGNAVTMRFGTTLRISGSAAFSTNKNFTFDYGADTYGATAVAANGTGANFVWDVTNSAGATISGSVNVTAGTLTKTGAGTLTLTGSGVQTLGRLNGGLGMHVSNGALVLDGGAGSEWRLGQAELTVGDTSGFLASFTLKSGSFRNGSWTSIGRGNGTSGLSSSLNIEGGSFSTGNLYTGFGVGLVAGYFAKPVINVSGSGVLSVTGGLRCSEQAGETTMNLSGSSVTRVNQITELAYGNSTRSTLNISDSASFGTGDLVVGRGGNTAANTAVGVINQSGGSVTGFGSFATGFGDWRVGGNNGANDSLVYGAWNVSGGTVDTGERNLQIGAYGRGVMQITGGSVTTATTNGWPVVGRFVGSFGLLDLQGGSFTQASPNQRLIIGEAGNGVVEIRGSGQMIWVGAVGLGSNNGGAGSGVLNLGELAGAGTASLTTLALYDFNDRPADGSSIVNFHGGTLKAYSDNLSFMRNLTAAVVWNGGARIDTDGKSILIAQSMVAPSGDGVSSIAVTDGGSGYVGAPIVQITGGGGTGATAVATVSAGAVTGITITNPGTGYTSAPVVSLLGGGAAVAATLGAVTTAANPAGGGLTKEGAGVLTLAVPQSYAGATTVNAGTLRLGGPATLATSVTPVAWWDAADDATLTLSGSDVTKWANKGSGGTGHDLTPGTFTAPTISTAALNGRNVVSFTSDGLVGSANVGITGTAPVSVFAVANRVDLGGGQDDIFMVHMGTTGIANQTVGVTSESGNSFYATWANDITGGILPVSQYNVHGFLLNGNAGEAWRDGTLVGTRGFARNTIDSPLYVGGRPGGDGEGNIGEAFVFNSYLSANDRMVAELYLRRKWSAAMSSNILPPLNDVTLAAGTTLDVNGIQQTVGSMTGPTGSFVMLGDGTLTVGADGSTSAFNGVMSGVGDLVKTAGGDFGLGGANTFSGVTRIDGGTVTLNDLAALQASTYDTDSAGSLVFGIGGTNVYQFGGLIGSGTVAAGSNTLAVSGAVSPGSSAGTMTVTGAVDLNGSFQVEIDDTACDRLNVSGALDLTGCALNVSVLAGGATQPVYVIASYGSLTGSFASVTGIPAGYTLNMAYAGGTQIALVAAAPSAYDTWAADKGLTPANDDPTMDPDGDGQNNLAEFGFDGNPLDGKSSGKILGKVLNVGGTDMLTLTIPVRLGTAFPVSVGDMISNPAVDGIIYTVEGSDDLGAWALDVDEVSGPEVTALHATLPALSDGPDVGTAADYEYKTFRSPGSVAGDPADFLRAKVEEN